MHQDIRCLLTFQVSPQTMSNLGIFFHAWGPLRRWLRKATRDAAVAYAVALWLEMVLLLAPWNDVCPRCSVCSRLPVEFSTLDRKGDYIYTRTYADWTEPYAEPTRIWKEFPCGRNMMEHVGTLLCRTKNTNKCPIFSVWFRVRFPHTEATRIN